MDQLKRMAIFAAVVERGSMRGASRQLGLTPSAVSQQLRALERSTGVTLLHRSTRKLTLTEAGARYHAGCAAMVAAARQADEALAALRDAPSGELRLAAPVGFAGLIAQALAPLLSAHPGLRLHLLADDAPTDLIAERIDLALRVGPWPDSSLVARRIGSFEPLLVAAPAYVAQRGLPRGPEDLERLDWLQRQPQGEARPVELQGPAGRTASLRPTPRVISRNQQSLQALCLAGLGIAALIAAEIETELREGRLIRLLPDWSLPPLPVLAVTPARDAQPAAVKLALAALQSLLQARAPRQAGGLPQAGHEGPARLDAGTGTPPRPGAEDPELRLPAPLP